MINYTDKEFETAKEKILKRLFGKYHGVLHPVAKLVCAQPGAGKSFLISQLMKENTAYINGDEFRYFHPHAHIMMSQSPDTFMEDTREFNGRMIEALIKELSDRKISLVIEGTLRRKEVPIQTKNILENKGYEVALCILAVPPELSYLRVLERAEKLKLAGSLPRKTNAEFQKGIVSNLVSHVDDIYKSHVFSSIEVYKVAAIGTEQVYSLKDTPEISPALTLEKEMQRLFTKGEYKVIEDHFKDYVSKEKIVKLLGNHVL